MIKYNNQTGQIDQIVDKDKMVGTLKKWEYEVCASKDLNVFFSFQTEAEILAIPIERRTIVLSEMIDERIGNHAELRIGEIVEMISEEIGEITPNLDTMLEATMQLRQNQHFCRNLYDEFLIGNSQNTELSDEQIIEQAQQTVVFKQLIDGGAVRILGNLIAHATFLTSEQKAYFKNKIDQYLTQ